MKALNFILIFATGIILLSSCQKEPVAGFKADKNPASVDEAVSFTNTTIDGDHYEWDFGDSQKSTDENPKHTYTAGGTYKVTLTAYSKNSKKTSTAVLDLVINNDNSVGGIVSYIGAISGIEYTADGATVNLVDSSTDEVIQTETTDADGIYLFYPVKDGTYYVEAEITVNGLYYYGFSNDFSAKTNEDITVDLVLE